jgi:hypothetical protein
MSPTHLLPEAANDADLQRIKARIRRGRFALFNADRLVVRSSLIGGACGLLGGLGYTAYILSPAASAPGVFRYPLDTISAIAVGSVVGGGLIGLISGYGFALLIIGLIRFFRPVYVALVYSPEEFEREYGDRPPQAR